jgi:hypothetical protein
MLAPSFVIPFTFLVVPERNILFWSGILLFCLERSSSSGNVIYVIGCFVATHCLLYYKEPIFVFVVAYAILRLLLSARIAWGRNRSRPCWREFAAMNAIPVGMIAIASIYAVLFFSCLGFSEFEYINEHAKASII